MSFFNDFEILNNFADKSVNSANDSHTGEACRPIREMF